jgi:predicted transcriptional regulator
MSKIEKMMTSLNEMNQQITEMKEMFGLLEKRAKKLSHAVEMAIKKEQKNETKAITRTP